MNGCSAVNGYTVWTPLSAVTSCAVSVAPLMPAVTSIPKSPSIACRPLTGSLLGGITVAITLVVSTHYRRKMRDDMEATLKMEMIQRGMSADEITKVLDARMSANRSTMSELLQSLPQVRMPAGLGKNCGKT